VCVFYGRVRHAGADMTAEERDTPAASLSRLTLSVRLCDYADCSKPLYWVLQCAKCKGVAYCSKDRQVCSPPPSWH
jgi:hypothetical protein